MLTQVPLCSVASGIKSSGKRADGSGMGLEAWIAVGIVAGLTAMLCLRLLGAYVQYETQLHDLRIKAHALRRHQIRRLAELEKQVIEVDEAPPLSLKKAA